MAKHHKKVSAKAEHVKKGRKKSGKKRHSKKHSMLKK